MGAMLLLLSQQHDNMRNILKSNSFQTHNNFDYTIHPTHNRFQSRSVQIVHHSTIFIVVQDHIVDGSGHQSLISIAALYTAYRTTTTTSKVALHRHGISARVAPQWDPNRLDGSTEKFCDPPGPNLFGFQAHRYGGLFYSYGKDFRCPPREKGIITHNKILYFTWTRWSTTAALLSTMGALLLTMMMKGTAGIELSNQRCFITHN